MSSEGRLTLDEVEAIIEKLQAYIDGKRYVRRENLYIDRVALTLVSRTLRTARAICVLTRAEFLEEAFALTRTLVDIWFAIKFVTNGDVGEVDERCKRWIRYFERDRLYWYEIFRKYYPGKHDDIKIDSTDLTRIKRHASEYASHASWSGLNTKSLAMEPDTIDPVDPDLILFDYEVTYKWTSHYAHATVLSNQAHMAEERKEFKCFHDPEANDHIRPLILHNVVAYMGKSIVRAMNVWNQSLPQELHDELYELLKRS